MERDQNDTDRRDTPLISQITFDNKYLLTRVYFSDLRFSRTLVTYFSLKPGIPNSTVEFPRKIRTFDLKLFFFHPPPPKERVRRHKVFLKYK